MSATPEQIRLTQYSHGAGCGCKIAPAVLDRILAGAGSSADPLLLVGNEERDDAAVYDLGDGTAVVSTTDFFMPSSPRCWSMNSRTSRPRSPTRATTMTSALALLVAIESRVDLPTPDPAKIPIR